MRSPLRTLPIVIALLAAPPAVADKTAPFAVELGDSTFLVRQVPWETLEQPDFLPLNGVDWVHDVIDADPVLGPLRVVFLIYERRSPPAWQFSDQGTPRQYGSRNLVPKPFRVEGLRVEVDPEAPAPYARYLYMEDGAGPSWMATCSARFPPDERSELSGCLLGIAYPRDGTISPRLRIYTPPHVAGIGETFPAAAARMVEILICLDVTGDVPATRAEADARLIRLRTRNPELRDCGRTS